MIANSNSLESPYKTLGIVSLILTRNSTSLFTSFSFKSFILVIKLERLYLLFTILILLIVRLEISITFSTKKVREWAKLLICFISSLITFSSFSEVILSEISKILLIGDFNWLDARNKKFDFSSVIWLISNLFLFNSLIILTSGFSIVKYINITINVWPVVAIKIDRS